MRRVPTSGKSLLLLLLCATGGWAAGSRVGGTADIAYESLNSGGISFATNGIWRLGGTLGQAGLIFVGTNGANEVQSGFWKMENGCEMYPVAISGMLQVTGQVRVTFNAMLSNVYTVASVAYEAGGPAAGTHLWTNLVATLSGGGGVGSVTTVFNSVSALTNAAQFYLIRCEEP
jgi:hypothetical protein